MIVNQVSDPYVSLRGLLASSHGGWLVLKDAELITARPEMPKPTIQKIDGDTVIHRDQVAFIEVQR